MFNELNSVEKHLVEVLKNLGWEYLKPEKLRRIETDIFLKERLQNRIAALNPKFKPEQIDLVIVELEKICLQSEQVGLVTANETFARWLRNEVTMPFGEKGQHVEVRLVDYQDIANNWFEFCTQFTYKTVFEKRLDLVLFINGFPVIVGECKTPVRPAISWMDGAMDIQQYEKDITPLFVPNIFSFATEGKTFQYGGVACPLEHWGVWRDEQNNGLEGLQSVENSVNLLLNRRNVVDILANFAIFATTPKRKKIKILGRYQQVEAANKIVEQVEKYKDSTDKADRKGLVWHFQGSGKSLLMVFTALKLRKSTMLGNPTVLIVVDRIDLDTQITGTFHASDIPNTISTNDRTQLQKLLKQDSRKIIITTIHKFAEAEGVLNDNKNIITLIDEAHRTQEGDLARKMRTALPNAFLFGLTGTPINKRDKNTFANFGGKEELYLSKYSYQDAVRDGATLPLHFEPRLLSMHLEKDDLDTAFEELTQDLEDREKASLSKKAANLQVWLKSSQRVEMIAEDIIKHFRTKIAPYKFKAQIVCVDREACILYKKAMDKILGNEHHTAIVMTVNSKENDYKKYQLSEDEEVQLLNNFRDENHDLQFLIVTNKLLTGFDAPILQAMYLDKTIREHNLLQAICRTNRLYPNKTHGLIVDYIGVFSNVAKAFDFDEKSVQESAKNIQELEGVLQMYLEKCMTYFEGIDRSKEGFEFLILAQQKLKEVELRDSFARDYSLLSKAWEILSPSTFLNQYEKDYIFVSEIYNSVRPINNSGKLLWHAFGEKTKALIDKHILKGELQTDIETIIMNAELLEELQAHPTSTKAKEFEIKLFTRVRKHLDNPKFAELSQELEKLKYEVETNQISSLEFLKRLVDSSQRLIFLEKKELNQNPRSEKAAINALSELFRDAKSDNTPIIVENIVNDIDSEIVKYVRVEGWKYNSAAEKDVRKCLLEVLKK